MRRETAFLSVAALVFSATAAMAQPSNFSGHWVQEVLAGTRAGPQPDGTGAPPPPGGARGPGGNNTSTFGNDFTVVMDAKTIKVWHVDPQATIDTIRVSYNLDGTESKNPGSGFIGTPAELVSTSKWEKKDFVVTTAGTNGPTITRMWMNGKQLYIQTDRPGPNPTAPGSSTLTIYNKKK